MSIESQPRDTGDCLKQLTKAFPDVDSFVAAYGMGKIPLMRSVKRDLCISINGESRSFSPGDKIICFPWKHGVLRAGGIGFFNESEVEG